MSNGKCIHKNPLQRNGTSQQQRMPEWLHPESISLHGFTQKDWLRYAYEFAKEIRYFSTDLPEFPQGNWESFFVANEDLDNFLKEVESRQNTEPHLALFIAFLKLIAFSQQQLNQVSRRHLDFYYQEVLQFHKREFVADHVFVVFELAKNVLNYRLEQGSVLDAGKDALKKNLAYGLRHELIVNTAVATQFKSILHQKGSSLRYADVASTADGIGQPVDPNNPTWFAFGQDGSTTGFATLPAVKTGFALASGVLAMQEGQRSIHLELSLEVPSDFDTNVFAPLAAHTTALITGESHWVPMIIHTASVTKNNLTAKLSMDLELAAKDEAIVPYQKEVHQEQYTTELPVLRLLWETVPGEPYEIYKQLAKARITQATIDISVKEYKAFQAENDQGIVDASKPFLPFGTLAGSGANFYLGSAEIFSKNWQDISLNIEWKELPDNLSDHYRAYQKRFLNPELTRQKYDLTANSGDSNREVQGNDYFNVAISYVKDGIWLNPALNRKLFVDNPIELSSTAAPVFTLYFPGLLYQTGTNKNKSVIQQYFQEHYAPVYQPYVPVFNLFTFNPGFLLLNLKNQAYSGNIKNNFLRIRLIQDFLHQHFARLYAVAMSVEGGDALIPQAPYTPTIAALSIDYTAKAQNNFKFSGSENTAAHKLNDYRNRSIQLFHEGPFGQAQQHAFLKEQVYPASIANRIQLLPLFPSEAEFRLGLSNAQAGTQVAILFQVAEGSENPSSPSFNEEVKITWSALGNNEWKPLNKEAIVRDTTNNFLRTGIITFQLPPHITNTNTLMPAGYHWLKAELPDGCKFDSVCRFLAIEAQAAEAVFENDDNDLSHLKNSLPAGTITKLRNRPAQVKKVKQVLASFGGAARESDEDFYTRVSERLRHKNRAITINDYERIVLNAFPEVHRVKCLNHTSPTQAGKEGHEMDPGYVTLIPIPNVSNQHLYDLLQPRVSNNKLREIEQLLAEQYSMHLQLSAENPQYEAVRFSFKVKFYPQYEQNTYRNILNKTLISYLAPWTVQGADQIAFGTRLYKTVVISYIEDLPYVDYLTDFKMYLSDSNDQSFVMAGTSKSILTSAPEHAISLITEAACP